MYYQACYLSHKREILHDGALPDFIEGCFHRAGNTKITLTLTLSTADLWSVELVVVETRMATTRIALHFTILCLSLDKLFENVKLV